MSQDFEGQEADVQTPETGDFNNIKHEFNRKLSETTEKMNSQISQLAESQKALIERLEGLTPKSQESSGDELADLWYSNPSEAAKRIKQETQAELRKEYQAQQAAQARQTKVINDLTAKYPELSNVSSPLTQKVYEIYEQFSPDEQANPASIKAAVLEAATELGIMPANKRQNIQEESYAMSSSTGSRRPPKQSEADEVDEKTLQWAALLGLNTQDKNVQERLRNRAKRKNWMKYE